MNGQDSNERFLYLLIEAVKTDNSGFYISCLAQNNGIDETKLKIENRLKKEGVKNCYIAEVGVVDSEEIDMTFYESEAIDDIRFSLSKSWFGSREDYNFISPNGIAISAHAFNDSEELLLSYAMIEDDYANYSIEIIPDLFTIENLVNFLCKELIDEVNFIGVYLDNQYDNKNEGNNAIWVKVQENENPVIFLIDNKDILLENGFLAIELGNQHNNNRLRITKTKEILFWTEDEDQIEKLTQKLNSMGFKKQKKNVSIGEDFENFKYRMKGSLGREKLIEFLKQNEFEQHRY